MHGGKTGCSNSKNNMHGTETDEEIGYRKRGSKSTSDVLLRIQN